MISTMCVCVCMHAALDIYMCVCMHICMYIYISSQIHTYMCVYMYTCIFCKNNSYKSFLPNNHLLYKRECHCSKPSWHFSFAGVQVNSCAIMLHISTSKHSEACSNINSHACGSPAAGPGWLALS